MTVSTTTNKVIRDGDGTIRTFNYNFKIFADADLDVYIRTDAGTETLKTLTTNYTVTGAGNDAGGNVVFVSGEAPAATEKVVIQRKLDLTQSTDYTPNDPFPAESHEEALDRLTFITQQIQEEVDRSIKASVGNTFASAEFTVDATERANKVFAFDASGNLAVTQEIGTFQGTDTTVTTEAYKQRDIIKSTTAAELNNIYICVADAVVGDSLTDTDHFALLVDAVSAATSATNAATSATSAGNAQTAAEAARDLALSYRNTAETHKNDAETAKTAAETAQAAAELAADNFDDTYLGSFTNATEPTVDNDGDALNAGDLYFNTDTNTLKVYTGSAWQDAALSSGDFISATGGTLTGNLNFNDSIKARFGAGNDLELYHDATNSYIENNTGELYVQADNITVQSDTGTETFITMDVNDGVDFYFNNTKKFETTADGVTVSGTAVATTNTDTTNTGNVTLDFGANQNFVLTLTGDVTLKNPSTEQVGQSGFIAFIQDSTGGHEVTLEGDYETAGGATLALSSAASTTDLVPYVVIASNRILLGAPQLAFS